MVVAPQRQHQCLSSVLSCELQIIKAKNLHYFKSIRSSGSLFVRYYLSAGAKKKIQLDSREISAGSDLVWNESFSLECSGTEDSIKELKQSSVVFELRWRKSSAANFLGQKSKSQLLGRAEIRWKEVFDSPNMEVENWVMMVPKSNRRVCDEDVKPPSLQVAMKIGAPKMVEMEKKNIRKSKKWDECGCAGNHGAACSCSDYEIFALMAAMEAM